jgi:hypothetical protein
MSRASQHQNPLSATVLRVLAGAGLAVDAYVHALGVLVRGRRLEAGFGMLIAASALGAVLLYRYIDPGALGPLPDMYDPAWYPERTLSAIAEGVALLACTALLLLRWRTRTRVLR